MSEDPSIYRARPEPPLAPVGPTPGSALVTAAEQMDWTQVVLNHQYGPPCFCLGKDGRFCGRAQTWAGHPSSHLYVSLADLIGLLEERGNVALDHLIALSAKDAPMEKHLETSDCAKCGGEGHPFCWDDEYPDIGPETYAVHCEECDNTGPIKADYNEAVKAWNDQNPPKSHSTSL